MFKCLEPGCKKKFKREQDVKMHFAKVHSSTKRLSTKRPYRRIALEDAKAVLRVRIDIMEEVLMILEKL